MESIPNDIEIYYDDKDMDGFDTPGLIRLLFALDHYGKKCDLITQIYCMDVWERIQKDRTIQMAVKNLLPLTIPNFYDCVRVHRIFLSIWGKFNHRSKQCHLQDCVCAPYDNSDLEELTLSK